MLSPNNFGVQIGANAGLSSRFCLEFSTRKTTIQGVLVQKCWARGVACLARFVASVNDLELQDCDARFWA